jgi:hypothetical protein
MKFFIPSMGPGNAEAFYQGIRTFVANQFGHQPTERRVYRVSYTHRGDRVDSQVGKQQGSDHETIYAILEASDSYRVCTPQHGVAALAPYVIPRKSVVEVVDFETTAPAEAAGSAGA